MDPLVTPASPRSVTTAGFTAADLQQHPFFRECGAAVTQGDPDVLCEPAAGEDCVSCPDDCNGVQKGNPGNQFCCGDGDGTNPVDCSSLTRAWPAVWSEPSGRSTRWH